MYYICTSDTCTIYVQVTHVLYSTVYNVSIIRLIKSEVLYVYIYITITINIQLININTSTNLPTFMACAAFAEAHRAPGVDEEDWPRGLLTHPWTIPWTMPGANVGSSVEASES